MFRSTRHPAAGACAAVALIAAGLTGAIVDNNGKVGLALFLAGAAGLLFLIGRRTVRAARPRLHRRQAGTRRTTPSFVGARTIAVAVVAMGALLAATNIFKSTDDDALSRAVNYGAWYGRAAHRHLARSRRCRKHQPMGRCDPVEGSSRWVSPDPQARRQATGRGTTPSTPFSRTLKALAENSHDFGHGCSGRKSARTRPSRSALTTLASRTCIVATARRRRHSRRSGARGWRQRAHRFGPGLPPAARNRRVSSSGASSCVEACTGTLVGADRRRA